MAVDLPHLTGVIPHAAEQAILRLREALEENQQELQRTRAQLASMPPPLSLSDVQKALGPQGSHPLPTAGLLNTTPAQTTPVPSDPTPNSIPNHNDIVQAVFASMPVGPTSTLEEIFKFTQTVAWQVLNNADPATQDPPGQTCGLLLKPSGEGIYTCAGESYSIKRVCYPNGQIFKVLADAGVGGANTPEWAEDGRVSASSYHAATNPSAPC